MQNEKAARLDAVLVSRGLAGGRDKAKQLIGAGCISVNGRVVTKPSTPVSVEDVISSAAEKPAYVSRGGYKLEKALRSSGIDLHGLCALDVGASTGGFTDCMLQNGAVRVYAVDVGHGQLNEKLRTDKRVISCEGLDIRDANILKIIPKASVQFCSVDVSFISIRQILPSIIPLLADQALLVCLIKPQFEAGRSAVGKNGVVRASKDHVRVLDELCRFFQSQNLWLRQLDFSPITGGEGNVEYLALLSLTPAVETISIDTSAVVDSAFRALRP